MFNFAQLERRIAALEANRGASLRFATVTEVNEDQGSARVQLEDGNNMVSYPLRILQARALKDQIQCFPDIGEPIACLFAGQGLEQGVILGATYTTKTPSPNQTASHDYVKYEDGTEIWYDRKEHKLIAKIKGDVELEVDKNLSAKIKGDALLEVEGKITAQAKETALIESEERITLRAPFVDILGVLSRRDYNGGISGGGTLYGNYEIRNGGLTVPDSDVNASAVSLVSHSHDNVENGPSVSGPPTGKQETEKDPNNDDAYEEYFNAIYEILPSNLTEMDKLLLCLPEIAMAESKRMQNADDKQGWEHLKGMFHRWFSGPANADPRSNPTPYWVDWEWANKFARTQTVLKDLQENVLNEEAKKELGGILKREGKLIDKKEPFNFIKSNWFDWEKNYHQHRKVPRENTTIDGSTAALAGFVLRALASGYTEPLPEGGHRICVTQVAVFVYDEFNFADNHILGFWNCDNKSFSLNPLSGSSVWDYSFRNFRQKIGKGNDFIVLSQPKILDNVTGECYVYP